MSFGWTWQAERATGCFERTLSDDFDVSLPIGVHAGDARTSIEIEMGAALQE